MAPLFVLPSRIPDSGSYGRENERQRRRRPPHVEAMFASRRNSSFCSTDPSSSSSPTSPTYRNSALSAHRNPSIFSTRSIPGSAAVSFCPVAPPSDDDIIIVTVKLSNQFRRASISGAEELPTRPRPRSFLGRVRTRLSANWDHAQEREERYKAVKMPRGEYNKYFRRDREGRFAGTAEEREWDEKRIDEVFGRWQDLPLRSVVS